MPEQRPGERVELRGGWFKPLLWLAPFFSPPLLIFLPIAVLVLIAFWIYVWITRNRRSSED